MVAELDSAIAFGARDFSFDAPAPFAAFAELSCQSVMDPLEVEVVVATAYGRLPPSAIWLQP